MYQVTLLGSQYAVVTVPAHAAADLTADHPIFRAPCACRIVSVTIVPGATITGANTNSANLNLKSWTDATTPVATELANRDYLSATNEVAMKARSFYAPAAPLALAVGQYLSLEREKVGSGLALPNFAVIVEWDTAAAA